MQLAMQSAEQTFRILKTKQFRVGVFSSIFQQLESKSTTHFLAAKKVKKNILVSILVVLSSHFPSYLKKLESQFDNKKKINHPACNTYQ